MSKFLVLFMSIFLPATIYAADPVLNCTVNKGYYFDQQLVKSWSSKDPNPYPEYKYYGVYMDGKTEEESSVTVIWGVDIGAGASPDSTNRFQILASSNSSKGEGVYVDTDATKPIDIAVYIPAGDITVRCVGN